MEDFSISLGDIKNNKVFDSQNLKEGMSVDELNNEDDKKIFNSIFDKNKDGTLSKEEREDALIELQKAAQPGEVQDNLSYEKAEKFLNKFNDLKNVTVEKFFSFLKNINEKTAPKAEVETEEKVEKKPEEEKLKYTPYTVQNGESFKKLIMQAYGIKSLKDPRLQEAIADFKEQNPRAVKTAKNGVQYLLVGAKVKLPGNLKDKNNSKEQIAAYTKAREVEKAKKDEETKIKTVKETKTPPKSAVTKTYSIPSSTTKPLNFKFLPKPQWSSPLGREYLEQDMLLADKEVKQPDGTTYEYDKDGYIVYTFDKNNNKTREIYGNADGSVDYYDDFEYDKNNNNTREIYRNADGSVNYYYDYEYDKNGKWTRTVRRNAEGSVDYYYDYEYNKNGKYTRGIVRNADGSVDYYKDFEYDKNGQYTGEVRKNKFGFPL